MEHQAQQVEVKPANKEKIRHFIKVMIYLAVITAVEFGIAFTVPHEHKMVRVVVFIALTINTTSTKWLESWYLLR